MRPTMLTLVISAITRPQPPMAKLPMCIKCQSLAVPSVELYWHIGETAARFASVNPRMVKGENKALGIRAILGDGNGRAAIIAAPELRARRSPISLRHPEVRA